MTIFRDDYIKNNAISTDKFLLVYYQKNLCTVVPGSVLLTKMLAFFLLLLWLSGWPNREKWVGAILPAAVLTERLVVFQMGRITCLNLLAY